MPNTALRSISKAVTRERVRKPARFVAAPVPDEVVERLPAFGMQRHGEEDDGSRLRDPRNFVERGASSSTCSTMSRAHTRSNAASANGNEVTSPTATEAPR